MLACDGAPLLIKAQFGVEREVVVDTDSEALGRGTGASTPTSPTKSRC